MLKKRRGEIATLLTLGLVLIGTLITLGTSLFVNKTKIASNPRASTVNCVYSATTCANAKKMGECPQGNLGNCVKCNNGQYRCPGTTDDSPSVPTTKIEPTTKTPTAIPPTTKIEPTTRAPTSAVTYKCCKVYETSSTCGGRKRIQNMGNGYSTTCSANSLVDCSSVGGPTTSRASICPEGSAPPPPTAAPAGGNYRLCCKKYACGLYGASAEQIKVTAIGFVGTNSQGTIGYTACTQANTGYSNVQFCDTISNPPTVNYGSTFVNDVACGYAAPTSSSAPTTPVGNSCEGDGKGVCVEKLFNNNTQNCNDYNPGSQPLSRSCGESSKLVCCSNLDYTPPAATKIPTPIISRNRTGRAGEPCIVKQVEEGEPVYVYSCINPGYVCSPPDYSGICVTPTPAGTTPGVTNPAATAVPNITYPTHDEKSAIVFVVNNRVNMMTNVTLAIKGVMGWLKSPAELGTLNSGEGIGTEFICMPLTGSGINLELAYQYQGENYYQKLNAKCGLDYTLVVN